MKANPLPSNELLNSLFRYDSESGKLFWKVGGSLGENRKRRKEVEVESLSGSGTRPYLGARIQHKIYLVHRIVWKLVTGKDPFGHQIDHVDGDRFNNRFSNLRLATHAENNQNTPLQKNNTSGVKGVSWHKQKSRWRANVAVGPRGRSKQISLGLFDKLSDAENAVREYRTKLHGKFTNHG